MPVDRALVYYLLYKPPGVISTRIDTHGRPTVMDLVPSEPAVVPVGRLDADSEGLIVLTNDGDLTHRLTHPRFGVTKTYVALVSGHVTKAVLARLVAGVELDDGPARAVDARVVARREGGLPPPAAIVDEAANLDDASTLDEASTLVEVVMAEGRNREVRRMLAAIGHDVRRLVRSAIGPLRDRKLAPGSWRPLRAAEVRALYEAAGAPWQDGASEDQGSR